MTRRRGKPRDLEAEALEREVCLNCTAPDCDPTMCPHRELLWGGNGYAPRVPRTEKSKGVRIRLTTKTAKTTKTAQTKNASDAPAKPVSITVPLPDAMEPQGEAAKLWSAYVNRRFGVNVRFAPEDVKNLDMLYSVADQMCMERGGEE